MLRAQQSSCAAGIEDTMMRGILFQADKGL